MEFRKYHKIYRLGKEETEGILNGICTLEEKIDGANTSIWKDETGWIRTASHNNEVKAGFNGFVDYVQKNEGIKNLLNMKEGIILYGEWLVRHTVSYNETSYRQWYMYDIWDGNLNEWMPPEGVIKLADAFNIKHPQVFGTFENPTKELIDTFAGKTNLGLKGEGVVIKNMNFKNKFGDIEYAKVVTQEFKEDNGIIFGGNNKDSNVYWETYVMNKYMTVERVRKIMNKIEPLIEEKFDMKHIPRIMGTCYHDLIVEEGWEISQKVNKIDYKELERLCNRKSKQIYVDIINNDVSVANQ